MLKGKRGGVAMRIGSKRKEGDNTATREWPCRESLSLFE